MAMQIMKHEGRMSKAYRCTSGKITIGIGHNCEDKRLPAEVIDLLFTYDMRDAMTDANLALKHYRINKDTLSEARFAVIVNMAFCMGLDSLLDFKNMFGGLAREDYTKAAAEILDSKFARKDAPSRAKELHDQMLSGQFNF